jgi:peptidoglycan hydrolase-like protein with peptidoglycan-binding domain
MSRLLQAVIAAAFALPIAAAGDELTQIVQKDLLTLGYEPGNTNGEATVDTIVAISKFQAEHGLDVTGKATPQLLGIRQAAAER